MKRGPKCPFDGHEDEIFARIAAGHTIVAIAADYDRSDFALHAFLRRPENQERAKEAKRVSADAILAKIDAEFDGLDEMDGDRLTSPIVQRAKLKVDHYRWLAAKRNPDEYGEKQGPLLQITTGDLHLAALQSGGRITLEQPMDMPLLESGDTDA